MTKERQSFYYYPDTAHIDIDYTDYNKCKNNPQKFLNEFNKIDFSDCSKEVKEYFLKKLKHSRRMFRKCSKGNEYKIEECYYIYLAISQLSAKVGQIIDTDIENINKKKRGMKRLTNIYDKLMIKNKKEKDLKDKWDEVLTKAIRKLGGE